MKQYTMFFILAFRFWIALVTQNFVPSVQAIVPSENQVLLTPAPRYVFRGPILEGSIGRFAFMIFI